MTELALDVDTATPPVRRVRRARAELASAIAANRALGERIDHERRVRVAENRLRGEHDLARTVEDVLQRPCRCCWCRAIRAWAYASASRPTRA